MPARRSHEPLPPKADNLHRLAKRLINIHGDRYGRCRTGVLDVRHSEEHGTQIDLLDDNGTWVHKTVFKYERDWDYEQNHAVNREFNQLGIAMKGAAKYWSMTVFEPDLADEVASRMQQALVLDELARVLGGDDPADGDDRNT